MGVRGFFYDLTPMRKVALVGAVVLWIGSAFLVFGVPLSRWTLQTAIIFVSLGAPSTAVVVVEMFRGISQRLSRWTDEKHFLWVGLVTAVLVIIQYSGIYIALNSRGM